MPVGQTPKHFPPFLGNFGNRGRRLPLTAGLHLERGLFLPMNLICAVCGGIAPARHQWYNRDTGYGVCPGCFEESIKKEGIEESIRLYGAPGIHHSIKPRPDEHCTLVVPPIVVCSMCGVKLAKIFASGQVLLEYLDGETESATLTEAQLAAGRENFFCLVSTVQSYRPKLKTVQRLRQAESDWQTIQKDIAKKCAEAAAHGKAVNDSL